jgi:hypothetical protein
MRKVYTRQAAIRSQTTGECQADTRIDEYAGAVSDRLTIDTRDIRGSLLGRHTNANRAGFICHTNSSDINVVIAGGEVGTGVTLDAGAKASRTTLPPAIQYVWCQPVRAVSSVVERLVYTQ